jgi:hypothetical protein
MFIRILYLKEEKIETWRMGGNLSHKFTQRSQRGQRTQRGK